MRRVGALIAICALASCVAEGKRENSLREHVSIVVDGKSDVAIRDAGGRGDSIANGMVVHGIPGCSRSANTTGNDARAMTAFSFLSRPEWPLEVSWVDSTRDTVLISAIVFAKQGPCGGDATLETQGNGGRVGWKLAPSAALVDKSCVEVTPLTPGE